MRSYLPKYSVADLSAYFLKHWLAKLAIYGSQRSNLKFDEEILSFPLPVLPTATEWF